MEKSYSSKNKIITILILSFIVDIAIIIGNFTALEKLREFIKDFLSQSVVYLFFGLIVFFVIGFICSLLLINNKVNINFDEQIHYLYKDLFSSVASRWQFSWALLSFSVFIIGLLLLFIFSIFMLLPVLSIVLLTILIYFVIYLNNKYIKITERNNED